MANQVTNATAVAIRAILVSHFPERFTKESLLPKLKEHDVDVLEVVNAERNPDFNLRHADIVICLKDFMSHQAYNNAKFVAKKHARPFITLTRKAADWESKLARYRVQVGEAAPASRRFQDTPRPLEVPPLSSTEVSEDIEDPTSDELNELLVMFEDENKRLEGDRNLLTQRLTDVDALASALERQLEQEKKRVAQLEKKLSDVPPPRTVIDKGALLTWDRLMRGVRSGNAPDFQALLEFAAVVDINVTELLSLMKG